MKGEVAFRKMFIAISVLLFAFFVFDLSLSYVNICQVLGSGGGTQCKLIPVIYLIPML